MPNTTTTGSTIKQRTNETNKRQRDTHRDTGGWRGAAMGGGFIRKEATGRTVKRPRPKRENDEQGRLRRYRDRDRDSYSDGVEDY
jgi:hypothetical protein